MSNERKMHMELSWSPVEKKHTSKDDQDTLKWLWKWKCIKLVTLLWYIMIHGQQNINWKEDPHGT
jgi:hypothetical protein